jgi:hypothetical protein
MNSKSDSGKKGRGGDGGECFSIPATLGREEERDAHVCTKQARRREREQEERSDDE